MWGAPSFLNTFLVQFLLSRFEVNRRQLLWTEEAGVPWHFITPGKPMQNGICEGFNAKMRDELFDKTLFHGLDHARAIVADWVAAYNFASLRPSFYVFEGIRFC